MPVAIRDGKIQVRGGKVLLGCCCEGEIEPGGACDNCPDIPASKYEFTIAGTTTVGACDYEPAADKYQKSVGTIDGTYCLTQITGCQWDAVSDSLLTYVYPNTDNTCAGPPVTGYPVGYRWLLARSGPTQWELTANVSAPGVGGVTGLLFYAIIETDLCNDPFEAENVNEDYMPGELPLVTGGTVSGGPSGCNPLP